MKSLAYAVLFFLIPVSGWTEVLGDKEKQQLFVEAVHILGGVKNPIVRWSNHVHFAIVAPENRMLISTITSIFADIASLTGIEYSRVEHRIANAADYLHSLDNTPEYNLGICGYPDSHICANYVVLITDIQSLHNIAKALPLRKVFQRLTNANAEILCFFSPGITSNLQIVRGFVFVRDDLDSGMLSTCLNEEIYQSFGLFNDYNSSGYFSFNNVVAEKTITEYDKALLTALYSPVFTAGSPVWYVARHMVDTMVE